MRKADIEALALWQPKAEPATEIAFTPARVLMQDFTGVPCVVDLAAMRDAMKDARRRPGEDQPARARSNWSSTTRCRWTITATPQAFADNANLEYERNQERYQFLRWGQNAFRNFKVVPPETGIVPSGEPRIPRPLRVRGRTRRGLPGYARRHRFAHHDDQRPGRARLGRRRHRSRGRDARPARSMLIPQVVGFKLSRQAEGRGDRDRPRAHRHADASQERRGRQVRRVLRPGACAAAARGPGDDRQHVAGIRRDVRHLPGRCRDACYLRGTGRPEELVALVEAYYREQGMFHDENVAEANYTDTLELDLATVEPSLAGPSRPQDRVALKDVKKSFAEALPKLMSAAKPKASLCRGRGRSHARRCRLRRKDQDRRCGCPQRHARSRLGGHCRHHQLHEHVEPLGDARGRRAREESRREGAHIQAVGQDEPRPRLARSSPIT